MLDSSISPHRNPFSQVANPQPSIRLQQLQQPLRQLLPPQLEAAGSVARGIQLGHGDQEAAVLGTTRGHEMLRRLQFGIEWDLCIAYV